MELQEIFDHVLTESGQFVLDAERLELREPQFLRLVKRVLEEYNPYEPILEKFNIYIPDRKYTFTEESPPRGIPKWVSDLKPVRIMGTHPFYFEEFSADRYNEYLVEKQQFPIEWRSPNLYVPIGGTYDVTCCYYRKITEVTTEGRTVYTVGDITIKDTPFFEILTGRFMMAIARNRRAFTLTDLPIETDADTLQSEGQEMVRAEKEVLEESDQMWWLAWG